MVTLYRNDEARTTTKGVGNSVNENCSSIDDRTGEGRGGEGGIGERGRARKNGKIWSGQGRGSEGYRPWIVITRHYRGSANHCNPYFIFCRFFILLPLPPSLPPTVSSKRASGYGPRLQASLDDDLIVSAIELPSPSPLPPSLFLSKCTPRFAPFKVSTPFFSLLVHRDDQPGLTGWFSLRSFLGVGEEGGVNTKLSLGWIRSVWISFGSFDWSFFAFRSFFSFFFWKW